MKKPDQLFPDRAFSLQRGFSADIECINNYFFPGAGPVLLRIINSVGNTHSRWLSGSPSITFSNISIAILPISSAGCEMVVRLGSEYLE